MLYLLLVKYCDLFIYLGGRLLTVVCPKDLGSPSCSPAKLIGNTIPKETAVIMAIKTIICLWNDKY